VQRLRRSLGWGLLGGELFCHVGGGLVDLVTRLGSRPWAQRLTHGVLAAT
jgi:hypothetical protein